MNERAIRAAWAKASDKAVEAFVTTLEGEHAKLGVLGVELPSEEPTSGRGAFMRDGRAI